MNTQDEQLLVRLQEKRKKIVDTLQDDAAIGIWDTIVGKYSDTAHFIYEILQNADDAGASVASFELHGQELIFKHNGSRHFSISDPTTEGKDKKAGVLGDINAITAIGLSNKIDEAKIGKFGMGFKAVFQYTNTPHIYDPGIKFKIENFMIPVLLNHDYPGRQSEETVFVFPFDRSEILPEEANEDIAGKLKNLVLPILFLHHLSEIRIDLGAEKGIFKKEIIEKRQFGDTEAVKYRLVNGNESKCDNLWLFTRTSESNHTYSVGYFVDDEKKELVCPRNYYAFCFFPTKVNTNLKFIIHAPFLLTDSREGIKATDIHNKKMIKLLARLSADALEYLIDISDEIGAHYVDDGILSIIPFNNELFADEDDRENISFMPFYDTIQKRMEHGLVPTRFGHTLKNNAYWSDTVEMAELFNDEQLTALLGKEAHWAFCSYGRNTAGHNAEEGLRAYIDSLTSDFFTEDKLFKLIDAKFIEKQSLDWLFKFYSFINDVQKRVDKIRFVPIFLTTKDKAIAAYSSYSRPSLYLPDEDSKGYDVVKEEIYEDEAGNKLLMSLGVKTPELEDKIFNKILKKESLNGKSDLRAFLDYYIELVENEESTYNLIHAIKEKEFILAVTEDKTEERICSAEDLYFPTDEMRTYFEGCGDILFVCMDEYASYLKKKEMKYFEDFLGELGVSKYVKVYRYDCEKEEVYAEFGNNWPEYTRYGLWYDYSLDETDRVLDRIADNNDKQLSVLLWKQLIHAFNVSKQGYGSPVIGGVFKYFFRAEYKTRFEGFGVRALKRYAWICDKDGNFRAPGELSVQEVASVYELASDDAKKLLALLGISDAHPEYEELDDSVRQKLEAYDAFAKSGLFDLPAEKIKQLMELLDNMQEADNDSHDDATKVSDSVKDKKKAVEDKVISDLSDRLQQRRKDESEGKEKKPVVKNVSDEADEDEITKATVDYSKKIEQAKQKCEDEISKLVQIEEARNTAIASSVYSYAWFVSMLQLEALANGDDNARSREVSIAFSKVERENGTNRTLILKHPDKNIPQVMEELVDIPLDLTFNDGQTKRLIIEVANVQSYTLRVKVKQDDFLAYTDFDGVTEAKIVTQNPTFLTRELQKEFARFAEEPYGFTDEYDMQQNLPENIEFIFGPPGTGKTTYLANNTLIPLIKKHKKVKVLVLTPTNKAADVLTSRIMQAMGDDLSYFDWLIRYGVTGDEEIEKSKVFHGKELEIDDYDRCVIVTTMARFPYDYFIDSTGNFNHLHGINWDYIVVDEASMIPLVQMVYMLYLKTPKQFIIAGDPFQIEPTTSVSEWKSENIYKMVNLEEFSEDAATVPHKYQIKLLTKQYRSVASIGEVFSQLTYNGVLEHARDNEDARPLNIERYLDYENLNIIKFPVSQFESIYRSKRLKLSSYQVYSALFVYEFATYISQALARENDEIFKIGIIAPYGAQAGLIDKLIASVDMPDNIEVSSGTIHGFQGDECDIVIALFNPPPHISTNKDMFLNRQNIINVAISRARDYLFVLIPDDDTENVQNLYLLNRMKKLIEKDLHTEHDTKVLEKLMFDNKDYLEENAFSTGHQSVNVYGLPEKRYEVRSEENALDVQVHGTFYYAPFTLIDEAERVLSVDELAELVKGEKVYHSKFGEGQIVNCDTSIVEAEFNGESHKFSFPRCFNGALTMIDMNVNEKLQKYLNQK